MAIETEQRPLRLLLIEDHADLAELTAGLLRVAGLEVRITDGGNAGLSIAAEFRPEIVLCDMRLPDMSGFDVARALRLIPGMEHSLLVVHTALSERDIAMLQKQPEAVNIDLFLAKPLSEEKIATLLSNYSATRRSRHSGRI